jgi:hypothetical protein
MKCLTSGVMAHAVAPDRKLAIDALPVIMSSISFCFSKTVVPSVFTLGKRLLDIKWV